MKVQYFQGQSNCERCGAYIKNIYVITFNDGYSITVGSECVKKVLHDTNLSEKGCTYVEKLLKPIEKLRKQLIMWQGMTYEKALEKHLLIMQWDDEANAHRDQTIEEFEETKKRMLDYLPKCLKKEEDAVNKILEEKGKNIHIKNK